MRGAISSAWRADSVLPGTDAHDPSSRPLAIRAYRLALRRAGHSLRTAALPTRRNHAPFAARAQSAASARRRPGADPLIEDGDLLLAESAAIVEYIIVRHGGGRLRLDPSHPDYAAYLYWFHFSNGNLQPVMGRLMVVSRTGLAADHPVQASVQVRFDRVMELIETRLREVPYFAGSEFTAADIMSVFSLTTMRLFQPVS